MTKYIAVWYAGGEYGFRGRFVESSSKQSAKNKHAEKHPDEARMVGIYNTGEFSKSFYNRNGSKISYMASPKQGMDLREWNEFINNHGLGLSWTRLPTWVKSLIQKAAFERVREGKHVW